MRNFRFLSAAVSITAIAAAFATPAMSAPFTYGNIAVTRIGTGGTGSSALTSAATASYIDEYTTSGTLVQSIALPTTGTSSLTNSGSATSEGGIQLSGDYRYLTIAGYRADAGTASVASTSTTTGTVTPRVAGRIDLLTGTVDTSTSFGSAYNTNNIRDIYSPDGVTLYGVGAGSGTAGAATNGGLFTTTLGSTSATQVSSQVTNVRRVNAFNGQLYISSNSGAFVGVSSVTGNTISLLPGFNSTAANGSTITGNTSSNSYDFAFASATTMYVGDATQGIQKWIFDGTNWQKQSYFGLYNNGTSNLPIQGISVDFYNPGTLYGVTASGSNLVKLVDTGSSFQVSSIAAAGANTAFRAVAVIVPEANTAALAGLALPLLAGAAVIRRRRK